MKKMISFLSAFLIVTGISLGTASADKSGVVKIPTHNWSSQLVGAEVVGELLKMVGEEIEYIPMDSQTVYQSMADGDIDLVHEIWEGAFGASYEKSLATGNVEEILTHDAVTREDWWYPNFVEETCPGLPSWAELCKVNDPTTIKSIPIYCINTNSSFKINFEYIAEKKGVKLSIGT